MGHWAGGAGAGRGAGGTAMPSSCPIAAFGFGFGFGFGLVGWSGGFICLLICLGMGQEHLTMCQG